MESENLETNLETKTESNRQMDNSDNQKNDQPPESNQMNVEDEKN